VEIDLTLNQADLQTMKNRLIVVSGQSKASPVVSSELALAAEAADDLAVKTAAAIAGVSTETMTSAEKPTAKVTTDHAKKKKSSSAGIILGALVLIGIIAAASGHHHGSSSSGGDNGGGSDNGGNPPNPPTFP
jgi:hypothetical protein